MLRTDQTQADEINLLKVIRLLCSTRIRHPMKIEKIKGWLKQFDQGPEKTLALLILRFLIYRTSDQLESSLKQAFKLASNHFMPPQLNPEDIDWRDVLSGKSSGLDFYYGPPKHEFTIPGKSGEIVSRQLKFCIPMDKTQLQYPDQIVTLQLNDRYLLIDDGTFTGDQLIEFISLRGQFMIRNLHKTGIVVGLAHEVAISALKKAFPEIPLFPGEKITSEECFIKVSEKWVTDGLWPYSDITPEAQYLAIIEKANFAKKMPLGFGGLGCLIAYEHGIPDDSLQLLWDESSTWQPLFER